MDVEHGMSWASVPGAITQLCVPWRESSVLGVVGVLGERGAVEGENRSAHLMSRVNPSVTRTLHPIFMHYE